nr:uncharacterized protein LOC127313175 [Lolium perenne]
MEADGLDEFYKLHQFKPSKENAVTYFLPRLLAGSPLPHGADMLIRHADVYACEPKDLAAEYAPVPSAVRTGDRFFFTTCKHKSGSDTRIARLAGAGTWAVQRTEDVYEEGAKVGEVKHLSFKKGKVSTGWVMEEYRCLRPEALVADGEKVLCKIHLAPKANAAARQESDAYKLRPEPAEPPVAVTASAHAQKRQAPVATADLNLSSSKKMRIDTPVHTPDEKEYEECPVWFTPPASVSLPTAYTFAAQADADMGMGRFSCSWEELLGIQQQEQTHPIQDLDIDELVASIDLESEDQLRPWDDDWESAEQTLPDDEAENNVQQLVLDEDIEQLDIDQLAAPTDRDSLDLQSPWDEEEADPQDRRMVQQEEQTLPIEAGNNVAKLVASIDWEFAEELQCLLADHEEEAAELYRRCNFNSAAADLHAPSLEGRNQFFSFGAVN